MLGLENEEFYSACIDYHFVAFLWSRVGLNKKRFSVEFFYHEKCCRGNFPTNPSTYPTGPMVTATAPPVFCLFSVTVRRKK